MAQQPIEDLQSLLVALGRERNLRGRLRVIARGWQLLRELAPAEREQVALRMGSNWAWKRVEKSFLRDGELDEDEAMIGRIFERLGASDPRELRSMAQSLRSGDHGAAKDMLLMTLEEALEEEADEEEANSDGPEPLFRTEAPETPARLELDELAEVRDLAVAALAPAESEARAAEPPAPPDESASPPASVPQSEPVAAPELPSAPEPQPAPEPQRATAPSPPAQVLPAAEPARPPVPSRPAARPAPPRTAATALAEAPAAPITNGLDRMRLLRRLREEARPGRALGADGRRRLIASLGGGWASRRALSSMIRGQSLDGVDEALSLVAQLERNGQRFWCLADLLDAEALEAADVERVLAAAPTDASRRRLTRRLEATR